MKQRRWIRVIGGIVILVAAAGVIGWVLITEPRPKGEPGLEAERVAGEMLQAVNAGAWKETGAVRFTLLKYRHLWDRRRGYSCVEWDGNVVLLRISTRTGRAWENGVEAGPERARELLRQAYARWVNDSFWLNPVAKMHDSGVARSLVRGPDGVPRLLVDYSSGGLTPGDAYLWTPGAGNAPPTEWRMWTRRPPFRGLAATWDGWITLSTGARISTLHRIGPFTLMLTDVAGARTLAELPGGAPDPFAGL